jgi:Dyp-type peroxidase family
MKKASSSNNSGNATSAGKRPSKPHPILSAKDIDPKSFEDLFQSIQGNILRGHGRDHTAHLFFSFTGKPEDNRRILKLLATRITSAAEQEQQRSAYKSGVKDATFRNLFLTAKGYLALGYSAADIAKAFPEPPNPDVSIPPQITFKNGMAFHEKELEDPNVTQWEPGYAQPNTDPSKRQLIDGMILLANDDLSKLKGDEKSIRSILASVAEIQVTEYGLAIFNQNRSQNLEHFGYVDGRSQPTFLKSQKDDEAKKDGVEVWDPSESLGLVLVPDAIVPKSKVSEYAFGSYFVFRKLEQNVRGFKAKEKLLADALGLEGDEAELAGAMAVGRFEDGTPVVQQAEDGLVDPVPNNFRFDVSDPQGSKCPFHAHIRKMSPRGDSLKAGNIPASKEEVERGHRIARRGITYGVRTVEPKDEPSLDQMPSGGVGLLFMCFQSNIDNQFGFMQRAWANGTQFSRPLFGDASAPHTGLDPVIGQPLGTIPDAQNWPSPWGSNTSKSYGFESFVKMLGGDFFFAPSIQFLKTL